MRAIVALLVLCVGAATAHAADDAEKKARAHFRAGQAHFQAGRFDDAIAEYQAAYALANKPELLFNIGSAYRRKAEVTHDPADKRAAIDFYKKYLDADPAAKAANDASTYIASLSREVEEYEATHAPPPAPPPPAPAPVVAPAPPPAAPPEPDTAPSEPGRVYRIAGIVTAGVGVALVATGVVFALKAKSASDDLAGLQPGQTWDQGLYDSGQAAQRNAYICIGTGAAAIAGGAVLYFVLGRPSPVSAQVSSRGALLTVGGTFR
jgi:tetratricopeptide (TPR) repeat protein